MHGFKKRLQQRHAATIPGSVSLSLSLVAF